MKRTASTPKTEQATTAPANVPVTTNFSPDVYSRISKLRKSKGFLSDQELIRLAVISFLDRSGA